jgi:hypothetical protein
MIKPYYCTRGGYLTRRGECEESFFPTDLMPGETLVAGYPPNGMQPPPLEVSYQYQRREAYPSLGAQLDALWHAMDQGMIPKVEPMYSEVKAVKEAYPKPSN